MASFLFVIEEVYHGCLPQQNSSKTYRKEQNMGERIEYTERYIMIILQLGMRTNQAGAELRFCVIRI